MMIIDTLLLLAMHVFEQPIVFTTMSSMLPTSNACDMSVGQYEWCRGLVLVRGIKSQIRDVNVAVTS